MKKISWNTFTKLSVGAYGCLLPPTPHPSDLQQLGAGETGLNVEKALIEGEIPEKKKFSISKTLFALYFSYLEKKQNWLKQFREFARNHSACKGLPWWLRR